MQRLLFHSLNTLIDTSALERRAFNVAFAESGLDWTWSDAEYNSLEMIAGERHRIVWYAEHSLGHPISCSKADLILWRKEQALCRLLQHNFATPRPGVLRLLDEAASADIQTALIIPQTKEWQNLSRTVRRFKDLSSLKVEHPSTHRARIGLNALASIEFNTTMMRADLHQGLVQLCVSVSSSASGAQACVTHLGEANFSAVQLSGQNILHKGSASLQSLLTLESSQKESVVALKERIPSNAKYFQTHDFQKTA